MLQKLYFTLADTSDTMAARCTVSSWQCSDLHVEDEAHESWSLEQPLTAKQFGALQMAILSQLSSYRKLRHDAKAQLYKASHLWG